MGDTDKLIHKFVESNISINKWDKTELDQLNNFLKKDVIGEHNEFKFGTENEKTNEWEYHKSGLNYFLGSSLNIELKFNKEFQLFVGETFKPEPKLISGHKLKKGDEIVQVELDGRYQYGPENFFEILSNLKPKSKIKLFFVRNKIDDNFDVSDKAVPIYETQSFDERVEMMKNKFKMSDKSNFEKKFKEWKRSLFQ